MLKKIVLFFFSVIFLSLVAIVGMLYWLVVLHPGQEITNENIQTILGKESPVLYSNGCTPLGVFFDDAHRQYVTWEQIPDVFVNALIASEDNRFFEHHGFDTVSITRAAIKNFEAGRVVQGGSTLTQQTAKNLFKRSGRSYEAKLKELLYALRLEYHYTKEHIFEFYCNQFYVRGNGHGLGVAARYYFDKHVEDLTLQESVFIAGSVKRPNYYNPFNRTSEEAKEEVRKRVKIRMAYVLAQMKQLGMITGKQYDEVVEADIVFTEGQVGYPLDYVMEMVTEAVASDEVQDALEAHGIGNLAIAGLRVITSVDKELQENTLYALRHELSRLDVRLRGYDREEVQKELASTNYRGDREIKKGAFLFGSITDLQWKNGQGLDGLQITVDFDEGIGQGVIEKDGLRRILAALVKWKKNRWSEVKKNDSSLLKEQLQLGDRVWVSIRECNKEGTVLLDLERFPELQGGALVFQNGMIKAMAGGVENRFYNRAIVAKRTMGSAFKPFVYAAALQLGWNSADLLQNNRDVFVFQRQPYFPRPDHKITTSEVSMSWAGVRSENLASVWLLYHLCDRLSSDEFMEVAAKVDLAPRVQNGKQEPYTQYRTRIRDTHGIVLNRPVLQEAAYASAVQHLETDFIFEDMVEEYSVLKNLNYGLNFDQYKKEINAALTAAKGKERTRKELYFRKSLLKVNYLSLSLRQQQFNTFKQSFQPEAIDPFDAHFSMGSSVFCYDQNKRRYAFVKKGNLTEDMSLVDRNRLQRYLAGASSDAIAKFWGDVLLDATISSAALALVEKNVNFEYERLSALSPYDFEVLAAVHDFRVLVGLRYLVEYGNEMGISSRLDPVLSFPLGSNVVTLLEAVRMYESLVTGNVFLVGEEQGMNRDILSVLDRIETIDGEVVYQAEVKKKELLAPEPRLALNHILENIVKFGTGRYAQEHVHLSVEEDTDKEEAEAMDLVIPLLGKTGTANDYTNASFFGYLPGVSTAGTGLVIDGGYTVGVYVGFDDNKAMRRKTTRITGSGGALPTWTDMINSILCEKSYGEKLDPVDLSFYGLTMLHDELGQVNLAVDKESGGQILKPAVEVDETNRSQPSIMTFGQIYETGRFKPKSRYAPFWGNTNQLIETDLQASR